MSLANDYRPKELSELVGQDRAVLVLTQFVKCFEAGSKVTPALLFHGPRGSGKTSAARIVSFMLNGKQGAWSIHEVDGARNGGVDEIRALETLARTGHRGNFRVIIIDEAQCLSGQAYSAFLKQLEEPPPDVLYILCTTDAHQIPETVRSRCFMIPFTPLDPADITVALAKIAIDRELEGEPAALEYIAARCDGDMRRAVMMLDQLAVVEAITVAQAAVLWPEPAVDFGELFIQTAQQADAAAALDVIYTAFRTTRSSSVLWSRITDELRERARVAESADGRARIAKLIAELWRFRLGVRAAPEDVAPVEGFWFTCADILVGGSRQIRREVVQRAPISADLEGETSNGNPFAHLEI